MWKIISVLLLIYWSEIYDGILKLTNGETLIKNQKMSKTAISKLPFYDNYKYAIVL